MAARFSALQALTRGDCLSGESAANEASFPTGPRARAPQGSLAQARPPLPKRPRGLPAPACAAPP